ncbi:double-strand break repair helicase AddA [Pararhodospirillum oryzae]|uniref:DNA 3'-5' helicase n=1 Tax=Pararhodospirillum oryzae TaxID=478448 RepID=A0A512HAX3_9PROT|nr:double-strand break repair helicase AddA [Pararhodospirillum oryzae]GEO82585.1 double-strand break repair helicase AddA [Pararhodospirillum oryzae]
MAVPDSARAQRRAADPRASAWVAASAGTGKTKVLTDRVLRLLLDGAMPQRLLCLTFTKAAAAEMANRIAGVLAGWSVMPDDALDGALETLLGAPLDPGPEGAALRRRARQLFARVLDAPGGPRIQTIHSFCQTLLRRFPLEAGVAPHFEVLDEREAQTLQVRAREALAHRALVARSPTTPGEENADPLAEALAEVAGHLDETRFDEVMAGLLTRRGRLEQALKDLGGAAGLARAVATHLDVDPADTPERILLAAGRDDAFDAPALRLAVQALLDHGSAKDGERAALMAPFLAEPTAGGRVALFGAYLDAFLTRTEQTPVKTLCTKAVETKRPGTRDVLIAEQTRLVAVHARLKRAGVARATIALMTLADAVLEDYQRRKALMGRLDYEDLILATRRLLEDGSAAAWVLYKLDGGLDHLLIDEAQDTSPEQWAIARALADAFFEDSSTWSKERPRTVFAVGDRKQSIYGFQGADPQAFDDARDHFKDRVEALGGRFETVPLNLSFRSTRPVLDAVNKVFAQKAARDGVAGADEDITHLPHRALDAGRVEVWPALKPENRADPEPWKPPVERIRTESARTRLARVVAAHIQRLTDGKTVLESRGRPVRPGDIMVLVRRRGGFETDLVGALKALKVPVAGVDRLVLADQIAVMDLIALGKALLLPEDDLSLACVLKGPLVGLSEEALFTLAQGRPRGVRLWSRLGAHAGARSEFGRAWAELAPWRERAGTVGPHAFYAHVLDGPGNGRRRLLARLGPEAEDPIDEFLALTLAFERGAPPSLQGFLTWLEQGDVEIKRDLDQGEPQAVRIMTVHGSKGLQAPIVILPDTLAKPRGTETLLWDTSADGHPLPLWCPSRALRDDTVTRLLEAAQAERDREYRRLLYVALTRAADRLIVCGWETRQTAPSDAWHGLVRDALAPDATECLDPFLVAAGLPEAPVLCLSAAQERAVPPTSAPPPVPVPAPPAWLEQPPPPEPVPPRPLAPSRPEDDPPALSPLGDARDPKRFQRGRLIHRLLQVLPEVDPPQRPARARAWLARPVWGLDDAGIDALLNETLAVLDHPACRAVFAPGSRAEVPLVGRLGSYVVSGQVDRLLVEPGRVLVADYKTNRPPPARVEDVERGVLRQMAAYRAVLRRVFPGRSVEGVLIWTDGPRVMPLPDALLDAAALGLDDTTTIPLETPSAAEGHDQTLDPLV